MLFRFFGLSDGLVGLLSVWGDVSRALDGSGCRVVWVWLLVWGRHLQAQLRISGFCVKPLRVSCLGFRRFVGLRDTPTLTPNS